MRGIAAIEDSGEGLAINAGCPHSGIVADGGARGGGGAALAWGRSQKLKGNHGDGNAGAAGWVESRSTSAAVIPSVALQRIFILQLSSQHAILSLVVHDECDALVWVEMSVVSTSSNIFLEESTMALNPAAG